ncbi:hypothetical protein EUTSA_v10018798mg [Eutrema salsugineum]|uniref:Uncharacterized protein n=1 Tax=Eutrema salsugineum TaxID=72664 RepID=V4M829_EUTSA|nr:cilia- and flagella-associated protein 251 [Eutrema salsugineum]ESQ27306.1 hypothetical protein EUTSA_v10018798mg [Eutrema salsugineum]
MIKGRDGNRGSTSSGYSADLLVCFPSRAHLALTPKPICSPSRPSDTNTRRPHHRRKLSRLSGGGGGGHGSPVLWAKQASSKNMGGDVIAEPTSPKVTCAGQIKVRPSKGKNWQSMMAEFEKIHRNKSEGKFLGLKKDVMGFLTCLRNIRFDFRCFGDFRHADITSDDDEEEGDDDDDDDDGEEKEEKEEEEKSKTLFSKWYMVLQEEQSNNDDHKKNNNCVVDEKHDLENSDAEPAVPPPNALLLMRCRSAPAKSWLEERMQAKTEQANREEQQEEEEEEETEDQEMSTEKKQKKKKDLRSLMEEEKMELVLMRYDTEYYRLSSDIAKETWVVGGIQDPLSRSRSWKN